jgi:hypothetical protein
MRTTTPTLFRILMRTGRVRRTDATPEATVAATAMAASVPMDLAIASLLGRDGQWRFLRPPPVSAAAAAAMEAEALREGTIVPAIVAVRASAVASKAHPR